MLWVSLEVDLKFTKPLLPLVWLIATINRLEKTNGIENAGFTATVRASDDNHVLKIRQFNAVNCTEVFN